MTPDRECFIRMHTHSAFSRVALGRRQSQPGANSVPLSHLHLRSRLADARIVRTGPYTVNSIRVSADAALWDSSPTHICFAVALP